MKTECDLAVQVSHLLEIEQAIEEIIRNASAGDGDRLYRYRGIELCVGPGDEQRAIMDQYRSAQFDAYARNYDNQFIAANRAFYTIVSARLAREYTPSIVDIGAGSGFVMDHAFGPTSFGKYIAVDPAEEMLKIIRHKSPRFPAVAISTICGPASEAFLGKSEASSELERAIAGERIDWVTCVAAMHVIDKFYGKTNEPRSEPDRLGARIVPILDSASALLRPGGRLMVGNYYHDNQTDYRTFCRNWKANQKALGEAQHQPTPPERLFGPEFMLEILTNLGFQPVEPIDFAQTHLGIRGYVVVAEKQ